MKGPGDDPTASMRRGSRNPAARSARGRRLPGLACPSRGLAAPENLWDEKCAESCHGAPPRLPAPISSPRSHLPPFPIPLITTSFSRLALQQVLPNSSWRTSNYQHQHAAGVESAGLGKRAYFLIKGTSSPVPGPPTGRHLPAISNPRSFYRDFPQRPPAGCPPTLFLQLCPRGPPLERSFTITPPTALSSCYSSIAWPGATDKKVSFRPAYLRLGRRLSHHPYRHLSI